MMRPSPCFLLSLLLLPSLLPAHDLGMDALDREALRLHILEEWQRERAAQTTASSAAGLQLAAATVANEAKAPPAAKAFLPFQRLDLRADNDFLYVGSNGLPDHSMMVGITAWQQQVPLPQNYFGGNAWRIPLHPRPAAQPSMIKGRFLRGAIALAVNGIPIFNPQNNRGEVSYEIGELDQWGGHCGRADDYHYHIVPLHLQAQAGKGMPVAYALDGYPIYGLTEPDGSPVGQVDECHGHETPGLGYHYHAAMKYPYVTGGFHGEVVEAGGQVDPQPRAQPVRPDTPPLRGAKITAFESTGKDGYKLSYEVNGEKRSVAYTIKSDGTYPFTFDNGRDGVVRTVYSARGGGARGGPPQAEERGPEKRKGKGTSNGRGDAENMPPQPRRDASAASTAGNGGSMPQPLLDLNADGIVSAQEFAGAAKAEAARHGIPEAQALGKARVDFQAQDRNHNGQLDPGEWQAGSPASTARDEGGKRGPAESAMEAQPQGNEPPAGNRGGRQESFVERPDQPRSSDGKFLLTSPVVEDMKDMPVEYTGYGEGATLPLAWKGTPAGTQGYVLIMDHADREGNMKWYWTLYDLPADLTSLPRNVKGVGKAGTGFKGQVGYEPPHSRGPGAKVYVLTLYALAEKASVSGTPGREELLAAIRGRVLASTSLRVIHVSKGQAEAEDGRGGAASPRQVAMGDTTPAAPTSARASTPERQPQRSEDNEGKAQAKGKGKSRGGPPGLIKPSIADTVKLNVYADNWFMLYVNGRLVAVDSIQFTPHNVVSVDFLPEYPMTIAVLAKDNADPKTGLEYGTSIGDGGFILKFADGAVTNASWKAKSFFHGPVNGDTASPKVVQEPLPAHWWAVDFDDGAWSNAKEYSVEQVDPKQPYFDNDFAGAKFIWTDDLALDNTIILRTRVEKPGWSPRWNTKPDLDVTGAPLR